MTRLLVPTTRTRSLRDVVDLFNGGSVNDVFLKRVFDGCRQLALD